MQTINNDVLTIISNIDLSAQDLNQLIWSPPNWLFLRHLEELASSSQFTDKVLVRDFQDFIRIQSKQLKQRIFNDWSGPLSSGDIAYRDLQSLDPNHVVYVSINEAVSELKPLSGVDIVDGFAISDTWLSKLVDAKVQTLNQGGAGTTDVAQALKERLQSGKEGERSLPETLYSHLKRKAEQHLITALSQKSNIEYHRFGTTVLTSEQYTIDQDKLLNQASENATSHWQQLKDNPNHEIKFTISTITDSTATVQASLSKDKKILKACDERFQASISSLEIENENKFATFWLDRVSSRVHIYAEGLASISDAKLQEQLSELLATYIQKDVVPDAISKARSQHLTMSRKTQKSISKLEAAIATSTDVPSLISALEKFSKKQNITPPTPDYKHTMLQDMHRRISKTNDAPVLYLTLIVVLLAKHSNGIVYATGKYAPKLMKLLKGKIADEEFEKLEKWKEGAKKGSLSKEDKEGMRMMAIGK